MTLKEEIIAYLASEKQQLIQELKLIKLGIFGSVARGEEDESSDIDIIVEFAKNTKDLRGKKEKLRSVVESKFNRQVDICREKYIKPYFRHQILKEAIYV